MSCGDGCSGDTGKTGSIETRFPQRVRATLVPSVMTVSPLASLNFLFVQNTWSPMR